MLGEVAPDVFEAHVTEFGEVGAQAAAEDDPRLGGLFELVLGDDALFYEIMPKSLHRLALLGGSSSPGRRLRSTLTIGIGAAIH